MQSLAGVGPDLFDCYAGYQLTAYVKAGVDLICFGGAARYESGSRVTKGGGGTRDEEIKLPLVRQLVREFDRADPKRRARKRRR